MSAVQAFRRSLSELDTGSTVTTPATFEDDLGAILDQPAVGTELPFDAVSLDRVEVTLDPSASELRAAATGVVGSRLGIASLGTVAIESRAAGDELVSLYPPENVVVLRAADLRPDLESAFDWLGDAFAAGDDSVVFATGPSATGDMGALVRGVHGPAEVHVVVIEAGDRGSTAEEERPADE